MEVGDHRTELGPEPAHHRLLQCLEHGHVEPTASARGRDLAADEPGADHHHLRPRFELPAQRRRVVERAQHVHAGEVGLVRSRRRQPVAMISPSNETHECARITAQARDIERDRRHAEHPFGVEVVDTLLAQHDALGVGGAREELLRKRRAVVREVGFGADRDDPAAVSSRRSASTARNPASDVPRPRPSASGAPRRRMSRVGPPGAANGTDATNWPET